MTLATDLWVGATFSMTHKDALVFTVDRVNRQTLAFHAPGEPPTSREIPLVRINQLLAAGEMKILSAPIDPTVIVAILEERPYATAELAALLGHPDAVVHRFLLGLQREGQVKRVGTAQRWALVSYIAPVGHPVSIPRDQVRAAIRRVLAGTTLATEDLVLRTGVNRHVIKDECRAMRDRGELVSFGVGRGSRWRLPVEDTVEASPPLDEPRDEPVDDEELPAFEDDDPAIEGDDPAIEGDDPAIELPDEDVETWAPPLRQPPPPRRERTASGKTLRQASTERYKNAGPSWWVSAPRDGFSDQARTQQTRMRGSKEHFQVKLRVLE